MLELIEEIQNTLNSNCLRVALGMALTLPDICGQVEYPRIKSVKDRYSKWCNTYLKNQGFITAGKSGDKIISGDMCYKLRCAYLHSGSLDLNQRKNDDFPEFRLLMCNKEDKKIYCEPIRMDEQGKEQMITIDVRHLTQVICNAAKDYYEQHENKNDFENHHIVIDDVEKIAENNMKFKQKLLNDILLKEGVFNPKELSENAQRLLKLLVEDQEEMMRMLYSNDDELDILSAMHELIRYKEWKLKDKREF